MIASARVFTHGWMVYRDLTGLEDIETSLRSHLAADDTLSDWTGQRIYPMTLPQNPTYPAVSYRRISRRPVHVKPGIVNPVVNPRWQFDVYAETYSAMRSTAEALKAALYTYNNSASPKVLDSMVDSEYELWDDLTKTFHVAVDVLIWMSED